MEKQNSLLRELAAILRDYQDRIDRIGPEAFRQRGESFRAWEKKRRRIHLCLELLEQAAAVTSADPDADLERIGREFASAAGAECKHLYEPEKLDGAATAWWDGIVMDLVQMSGDLSRLHAGATGEPAIARRLEYATEHVVCAAKLAIPKSRYARKDRTP